MQAVFLLYMTNIPFDFGSSIHADAASAPRVLVLVPVKNEAWILPRFLECTLLWADHIIVADQNSEDDSAQIARRYERVTVIENASSAYSEEERQKLLIAAARQFPAPRLLMALDADEIISANILDSAEWKAVLEAPPGTQIQMAKVELTSSPDFYFLHSTHDKEHWIPFGYMDDGVAHEGTRLHSNRLPDVPHAPRLRLNEIVLMHFNRCNMPRLESKDRWYRCFETLNFPHKSATEITRLYDWHERLKTTWKIRPVPQEWLAAFRHRNIDMSSVFVDAVFWWDWDILRLFKKHGTAPFRHLDIWDFDWEALRKKGLSDGVSGLPDEPILVPQKRRDRWVRDTLRNTQNHPRRRYTDFLIKRLARFL